MRTLLASLRLGKHIRMAARTRPLYQALSSTQKRYIATGSSADADELGRFARLSHKWWAPGGPFELLRGMNSARIPFIRENCINGGLCEHMSPLEGVQVLDIGCGGGFLSEPLARMRAKVTAVDASEECVNVAKAHAAQVGLADRINYIVGTAEELVSGDTERGPLVGSFDAVCALEIIEHVRDANQFVSDCIALLRPGGLLFLSTINRTPLAKLLALRVAEDLLSIVPKGTHQYEKFLMPGEIEAMASSHGASVVDIRAMTLLPVVNQWKLTPRPPLDCMLVNYIMCIQRGMDFPKTDDSE